MYEYGAAFVNVGTNKLKRRRKVLSNVSLGQIQQFHAQILEFFREQVFNRRRAIENAGYFTLFQP